MPAIDRPLSVCRLFGGLGHCLHLQLLMWLGPRLDRETGRFLHRRITQHYGGWAIMAFLHWVCTRLVVGDPIDQTVFYTGGTQFISIFCRNMMMFC